MSVCSCCQNSELCLHTARLHAPSVLTATLQQRECTDAGLPRAVGNGLPEGHRSAGVVSRSGGNLGKDISRSHRIVY